MKNILVIAAHPDDEVLGCGGTMARLSKKGSLINILIVAEGITSRDRERDIKKRSNDLLKLRMDARSSAKVLGAKSINFLDYPDNRLDTVPLLDIVKNIELYIKKFKPDVVFTHSENDMNIDHSIVSRASLTACRPVPNLTVKKVYAFEVLSSTEYNPYSTFQPNYFVNIEEVINKKINALQKYKSEMRASPHPRSIIASKNLASLRGSVVGLKYAEAFRLLREIF
jgi:LmbE family N-acetylglucosaminyl deacetylase